MSVDIFASAACRVGQCLLLWGAARECSQPRVLFSSDATRRGSVRAARRFMRALSGKFVFHLPVHQAPSGRGPRRGPVRRGLVGLLARLLLGRRPWKSPKNPRRLVCLKNSSRHDAACCASSSGFRQPSTPSKHRNESCVARERPEQRFLAPTGCPASHAATPGCAGCCRCCSRHHGPATPSSARTRP